jgi:ribose transport system ATP-binding protein
MELDPSPLLSIRALTKRFPGVTALQNVDLEVVPGEVHALVGENGAGKSSLVKVLGGVHQPDSGEMTFAGDAYRPKSTSDALGAGIRLVHQELNLLPYLSIAENLFIDALPHRLGLLDRRTLHRRSRELLDEVGLDIPVSTKVERLGIAQMQLVEIAKAISGDSRLLIMDEPTATLTPRETDRLFQIIRRLSEQGVAVIYISHHLDEVFEIGDRVTVLRNGCNVGTHDVADLSVPAIVTMMVGRDLAHEYPPRGVASIGEPLLRVEALRVRGSRHTVSFTAHRGELLGVAGLVGAGRTETMRAVFGADPHDGGTVHVRGTAVAITHPQHAVAHGISLLTEDRKGQGLVLDMSVEVNTTLADPGKVARAGLLSRAVERSQARRLAEVLRIKTPSVRQLVRNLSGGNQQKVVLAKWLFRDSDVLITDEPTRGIDVGARYEIHELLITLANAGKAIVVVSSDLPELIGICDRIIVFSRGRITGEVVRRDFDQERILALAYRDYLSDASNGIGATADDPSTSKVGERG